MIPKQFSDSEDNFESRIPQLLKLSVKYKGKGKIKSLSFTSKDSSCLGFSTATTSGQCNNKKCPDDISKYIQRSNTFEGRYLRMYSSKMRMESNKEKGMCIRNVENNPGAQ